MTYDQYKLATPDNYFTKEVEVSECTCGAKIQVEEVMCDDCLCELEDQKK